MKYKEMKLGDVAEINMGQSPNSKYFNSDGKGIEFLQGIRTFGENYPSFDTYTTQYNKISKKGDILFSVRAPVGKVNWSDRKIAIGRGLAALNVLPNFSSKYVYYFLKKVGSQINSISSGTVFSSINKKELANVKILIPDSLKDQEYIGTRLALLDKKIELNNQINDNLFEIANLIFENQLNNDCTKLSNIATIQNGYAFKSKEYISQKQLLILRTKNIESNHLFNKSDVVYINQDNFCKYKKFAFNKFDTALVMVGANIGKTGFITSNVLPALQNQNMWRFRSKDSKMPGLLLYEYVNYINKKVQGYASGSARSFYRKKVFSDFEVPIIDSNFFKYFERIQFQINNIQLENNILVELKQEMLNKYF